MVKSRPLTSAETASLARFLDESLRACEDAGVRPSAIRREMLAILATTREPLGAYELLAQLEKRLDKTIGASTIYRALESLVRLDLVARIESRNGFVLSRAARDVAYFLCDRCNICVEVRSPEVTALLAEGASSVGFHLDRQIVECSGLCAKCAKSPLPRLLPHGRPTFVPARTWSKSNATPQSKRSPAAHLPPQDTATQEAGA
jgi:Fur family zinc uptake transcriptional regulator